MKSKQNMSDGGDSLEVEREPSRLEAFAAILKEDDFHDVALKGKDGVIVHANRFVLAARSLVFRKMLLGNFTEASSEVVNILDYNGIMILKTFGVGESIKTLCEFGPVD